MLPLSEHVSDCAEPSLAAVISSTRKPVSAKQNFSAPRACVLAFLYQLLGFLLLFAAAVSAADSQEEAARALARKVAANIRGTTTSCEIRNLSHLGNAEFSAFSSAFQDELQRRGIRISTAEPPVSLVVTVTQTPTEYIAVAQIQRKQDTETVMQTLGKVGSGADPHAVSNAAVRKDLLFSQDEPIFDVALNAESRKATALGPQDITFYEWTTDRWVRVRSEPLPVQLHPQRATRGFLTLGGDGSATALFPGEVCRSGAADTNKWTCEPSSAPIPIRTMNQEAWAGAKDSTWISAAKLASAGRSQIVLAGRDGLARLYEEGPEPAAFFSNWGSQLVAVNSGCGTGAQLLVTGTGDWTKNDEIRAMEIQERKAVAVSLPASFDGPVLGLLTPGAMAPEASSGGLSNSTAIAIDRNLQTGRYEAYRLTISCAH